MHRLNANCVDLTRVQVFENDHREKIKKLVLQVDIAVLSLSLSLSPPLPLSLLISTVTCTQLIMPFEALKMIIDVGFGFDLVAAIQKINEE